MSGARDLAIIGALVLAFAALARRSSHVDPEIPEWSDNPDTIFGDEGQPVDSYPQRLAAFLFMIGAAETSVDRMRDGRAFTTYYGMTFFHSMSDHPVLTGEKVGIPLPPEMCRRAGFGPGCVSTAAGAFQINLPTWRTVREASPSWGPRLPDFGPESQQEAARRVLILCGALGPLELGDFNATLALASQRWASLHGSTVGQNPKSPERLAALYAEGLGTFA